MADGRMIRKKASSDDRLAQLSSNACLLYLHALPHLDVEGRMDGLPVAVRGTVVPYRARRHPAEWTDELVERYICEWTLTVDEDGHVRPLVLWYAVKGVWVCAFLGFDKNQTIRRDREAPSRFPAPPGDLLSSIPACAVTPQDAAPAEESDADRTITGERLFADPDAAPEFLPHEAEAQVQVQPPEQIEANFDARAREGVAALVERSLSSAPPTSSRRDLSTLLSVLPDADRNTEHVLHEIFDDLPPHFVGLAIEELAAAESVRRPSAYVVRIGQRMREQLQRRQGALA